MQLDKTRIVIRQRSTSELLDLSLKICVQYAKPLFALTFVFALPFMVLNELLIGEIVYGEIGRETVGSYLTLMAFLVFLEAPTATLATTLFLGRMMFLQDTDVRFVLGELKQFLGRILWTQLILRGVLIALPLAYNSVRSEAATAFLSLLVLVMVLVRMLRPFISEIVLLERNPIRKNDKNTITIRKRSHSLHGPSGGELIGRSFLVFPAMVAATVSIAFSLWFIQGILTNQWVWNWFLVRVQIPLAMWMVVVFSTVFRFLNYLDIRIRREGWEVELKLQAAVSEYEGQVA